MTLLSRREGSNGVYSEGLERSITDDRSRNYLLYFSAILMEKKERRAYEHKERSKSKSKGRSMGKGGAFFSRCVLVCVFECVCACLVSFKQDGGGGVAVCVRCLLALDSSTSTMSILWILAHFVHFSLRFGFEIRIRIAVVLGVVLWIVVCESVLGKIVV